MSPSTRSPTTRASSHLAVLVGASIALAIVSGIASTVLAGARGETVATAVLPGADGPVPLLLVGVLWVVVPACVLVLVAVTIRTDGRPRWWARAAVLGTAAWIGTIPFFHTSRTSSDDYYVRSFGTASARVEAVATGTGLGIGCVVGAGAITFVVAVLLFRLVPSFRLPTDWQERTPEEQRTWSAPRGRLVGLVLLGLLVTGPVVVAVVTT